MAESFCLLQIGKFHVGKPEATGPVTIGPLTHIIYTASNTIKLTSGFSVSSNAEFHAKIAPCPNSLSSRGFVNNKIGSPFEIIPSNIQGEELVDKESTFNNTRFDMIYPNPTQGKVSVNVFSPTQQNAVQLSIEDLTGKIVFMQTLDLNAGLSHNELNLLDLANGVYLIKYLDSKNTQIKVDKLMIAK